MQSYTPSIHNDYISSQIEHDRRSQMLDPNIDAFWKAQPRQLALDAPIVFQSVITKVFGPHPYHLPLPKFLGPCWLVRQRYRASSKYIYFLFCWCDECKIWDLHFGDSEVPTEIALGGTIEAFHPHHGYGCATPHTPHDTDKQFFAYYNFGAAPEKIQQIYSRYRRAGKEHCHAAPPEPLRRIEVFEDRSPGVTKSALQLIET